MRKDISSIYHYTSISGLKGIIESGCLHATNIKYLNDSKEFVFGLDYFSKLFSEVISDTEFHKPIFDHLIEYLFKQELYSFRYERVELNCYVVSFSKNPDVLSQWRAYGKENAGYCIKFNYNKLSYPSDSLEGMITKVEYIDPNDLSFARNKLEEIKEEWKAEFFNHIPWLEPGNLGEYEKMLKRLRELDEKSGGLFKISLEENTENSPKNVDISDDNPSWYDAINKFREGAQGS